jgi:hypothetical protein
LIVRIFEEALDRNDMTIKILPAPKQAVTTAEIIFTEANDNHVNPIVIKEESPEAARKK